MFALSCKLYPITDTARSGLSHAEQVERMIAGGATLIQLRDKTSAAREFHQQARLAIKIAKPRGARLIINDRIDIALAIGAAGVHLGQDDLPPAAAREILGPDAIIGYSTHSLEQARLARTLPVDYIAIGPVFETTTKANPHPTVGLHNLRRLRDALPTNPLVAIG